MRTVPQALLDAMTSSRTIGARITVRKILPTFSDGLVDDEAIYPNFQSYDANIYNGVLQRVAITGTQVLWAFGETGAWSAGSLATFAGSGIGIYGNTLFFQDSNGAYNRKAAIGDWLITSPLTPSNADPTVPALFAPVSDTAAFIMQIHDNTEFGHGYQYGILTYYDSTNTYEFPGAIYEVGTTFDAETINGVHYVYFTDQEGKRAQYLKLVSNAWSEVMPVIPMDIVDTQSGFTLAAVSQINGRAVLTGILTRESGDPMHIYSIGPENHTLGRDLFITENHVVEEPSTGGNTVPAIGGKLLLLNDQLIYTGPGVLATASATNLFGYDNPDLKMTTDAIANISLTRSSNSTDKLSFDLYSQLDDPLLVPNNEVELEFSYGGIFASVGKFGIDAYVRLNEQTGPSKHIAARSDAMRRLANWTPDAAYDYWSQSKNANPPSSLENVIRATGQWSGDDLLVLDQLNTDGFLYSIEQPSRGAIAQARFTATPDPVGLYDVRYGVMVNYYQETRLEAAERTGKNEMDIAELDYGHNGIIAIFGKDQDSGDTGLGLYLVRDNFWSKLDSVGMSLPSGEHWLRLEFHDGLIRVYYRQGYTWALILTHRLTTNFDLPWKYDYRGRTGIYMHQYTAHSHNSRLRQRDHGYSSQQCR